MQKQNVKHISFYCVVSVINFFCSMHMSTFSCVGVTHAYGGNVCCVKLQQQFYNLPSMLAVHFIIGYHEG